MTGLVIDLFAGGGGASTGIEMALGRQVDAAVNHDPVALALHMANHPETEHYQNDVWAVSPNHVTRGRVVDLLWGSPDCTHFSKAKGAAPKRDQRRRDLAWVIEKWAREARPAVILMENVEEFRDWGPLDIAGKVIESQKGTTFRAWIAALRRAGYKVQHRELRACDYGAPTIRKRLFVVARRDGLPIVWPRPTHGDPKSAAVRTGRLLPWRTAAECLDFGLPCPSIFDTAAEIRAKHGVGSQRPLARNTMRRIAEGLRRYVLESPAPFIVQYNGCSESHGLNEPVNSVTSRDRLGLVSPYITEHANASHQRNFPADEPLRTQCAQVKGGHFAVVAPYVVKANHGYAYFRGNDVQEPLRTVTANEPGFALAAPHLVTNTTGHQGSRADAPLATLTTGEQQILSTPYMVPRYGERPGQAPRSRPVDEPMPVVVPTGNGGSLVTPFLAGAGGPVYAGKPVRADAPLGAVLAENHRGVVAPVLVKNFGGVVGTRVDQPAGTVTTIDHHALAAMHLQRDFSRGVGHAADEPCGTIMAGGGGHEKLVAAWLNKYYRDGGQNQAAGDPLHTVTAKARFSLVTTRPGNHAAKVSMLVAGLDPCRPEPVLDRWEERLFEPYPVTVELGGQVFTIPDIGMRMLTPRELYRAQGFPEDYVITCTIGGKPLPKSDQVRLVGNSVCPPMAAALVRANCGWMLEQAEAAEPRAGEVLAVETRA